MFVRLKDCSKNEIVRRDFLDRGGKMNRFTRIFLIFLGVIVLLAGGLLMREQQQERTHKKITSSTTSTSQTTSKTKEQTGKLSAKPKDFPDVKTTDWQLVLVNDKSENKFDDSSVPLVSLDSGFQVRKGVETAYNELAAAASKAGYPLIVISSYRSVATQKAVQAEDIQKYKNQGMTDAQAKAASAKYVAEPGHSEHNTGLALDVIDQSWNQANGGLVAAFGETAGGKWLAAHAPEYGFVIRYPKNKEKITMIDYESWHIRYVGKASAEYMAQHQLVLEEYLALVKKYQK